MIAPDESRPLLDAHDGDEKKAHIMIDSLLPGLGQAATGTQARIGIGDFGFGLNPGDEKHAFVLGPVQPTSCN
jgi:hypothetical protein